MIRRVAVATVSRAENRNIGACSRCIVPLAATSFACTFSSTLAVCVSLVSAESSLAFSAPFSAFFASSLACHFSSQPLCFLSLQSCFLYCQFYLLRLLRLVLRLFRLLQILSPRFQTPNCLLSCDMHHDDDGRHLQNLSRWDRVPMNAFGQTHECGLMHHERQLDRVRALNPQRRTQSSADGAKRWGAMCSKCARVSVGVRAVVSRL
ncbi:hypothetical protein OF83DRAFT_1114948 [Amylostereum chailletii]|nr:hypothetical protein OF83DRAFT_1114948 [Amylostereum chailletii]